MCINKRWITNPHNGKHYFVNCGHCVDCRTDKASAQFERLLSHYENSDYFSLFVTLTYANEFVPYTYLSDLCKPVIKVYRANKVRYRWHKLILEPGECVIEEFEPDAFFYKHWSKGTFDEIHSLEGQPDCNKIGIALSSDFSKFKKRFQVNLKRYYGLQISQLNFSYYRVSEYGPTTFRPHFHTILSFPKSWSKYYQQIKRAIIKSWPYCDYARWEKGCEIAINPLSYTSQYAVTPSDLPDYLTARRICPKHSFSRGFGFNRKEFTRDGIFRALERRDFRYYRQFFDEKKGQLVHIERSIPFYVYSRYFPYIKGLCNLDGRELYSLLTTFRFEPYASLMGLKSDEVKVYTNRLKTAFKRSLLPTSVDYYYSYINYYSYSRLYTLQQFYIRQELGEIKPEYSYDNPEQVYHDVFAGFDDNNISNTFCAAIPYHQHIRRYQCSEYSFARNIIITPNEYPDALNKHTKSIIQYEKHHKESKLKDINPPELLNYSLKSNRYVNLKKTNCKSDVASLRT